MNKKQSKTVHESFAKFFENNRGQTTIYLVIGRQFWSIPTAMEVP